MDDQRSSRGVRPDSGRRLAAGLPIDEAFYGEWVADVIRPPEELRFRYQLRLADARALLCL
jgi:hypothetical protein